MHSIPVAMAGWLHGVFVGEWLFVFPLCGFSLSLICNYSVTVVTSPSHLEEWKESRQASHRSPRSNRHERRVTTGNTVTLLIS